MFCTKCGKPMDTGSRFCTACGAPVEDAVASPSQTTPSAGGLIAPPAPVASAAPIAPVAGATPSADAARAPSPMTNRAFIVLIAVVAIAAVVAGGLYLNSLRANGATAATNIAVSESAASDEAASDFVPAEEGDSAASTDEAVGSEPGYGGAEPAAGPSARESYDLIYQAYVAAGTLGDEIGKAYTDGTYGGTGFAYEVFNPGIGGKDYAMRVRLAEQCEALVARVEQARNDLRTAAIDAAYEAERSEVIALYGNLYDRADAMRDAADIAVDSPDESAWRSVLTPRSSDARKSFDAAYPGAAPTGP